MTEPNRDDDTEASERALRHEAKNWPPFDDPAVIPIRHVLLQRAWRAHPQHVQLVALQAEGWEIEHWGDGDWVGWTLRPQDPRDERKPIVIFRLLRKELERLERDQEALWTEHDADE